MTTCVVEMVLNVRAHGVNAPAYADFVSSTINTLSPANSEIGATYASTVAETTTLVNLLVLLVVFFVFFVLALLMLHERYIGTTTFISVVAAALMIIVLFYVLNRSYATSVAFDVMPQFQQTLVKSFLYVGNSGVRDAIYLGVCE